MPAARGSPLDLGAAHPWWSKALMLTQFGVISLVALLLHGCSVSGDDSALATSECPSVYGEGKTYCPQGYSYEIVSESFATTIAYCIRNTSTVEATRADTTIDVTGDEYYGTDTIDTIGSGTAGNCQWCSANQISAPEQNGAGACWTPYFDAQAECPEQYPFASGANNAWCSKSQNLGIVDAVYYRGLLGGSWHCCKEQDWNVGTSYCDNPYLCEQGTSATAGTFTEEYQMAVTCGKAPCATHGFV
ncbi:unnamed protein product [Prorocentrum cordatum]|uniref:Cellulase n=1 Tax=Prorocentrum cordatum TaxID=2364126 RepID=A0ABN9UPL2_9DINO|nr:unnamed protein product [Polarella glacialis]